MGGRKSMLTAIFICKKRFLYYNLKKYFIPEQYRFVCVLTEEGSKNFPGEYDELFAKKYAVDSYSESNLEKIIATETKHNDIANIRLVCADETSLLAVAKMRVKYSIPGSTYSDLLPYRDKVLMKKELQKSDIKVPGFVKVTATTDFDGICETANLPFIIKPVSGASSLATNLINSKKDFDDFIAKYPNEEFEAEEYINGDLYHADGIYKNGTIDFLLTSKYSAPCLDVSGK